MECRLYIHWQFKLSEHVPVPELLEDILIVCDRDTFQTIFMLIKVAITIPVTTCENERRHSQLKVIKASLRCALSQKRLSGLSMLKIHKQQEGQLDIDALITKFFTDNAAEMHNK